MSKNPWICLRVQNPSPRIRFAPDATSKFVTEIGSDGHARLVLRSCDGTVNGKSAVMPPRCPPQTHPS